MTNSAAPRAAVLALVGVLLAFAFALKLDSLPAGAILGVGIVIVLAVKVARARK